MCGCIMADVREGEACFQERSSSIIKMWDLFETGSSLLSVLCIFLGFESYLEQTFLGLFRCALRKNFQIDNCLQVTKQSPYHRVFLFSHFTGCFHKHAAEKSVILETAFVTSHPHICVFFLINVIVLCNL